MAIKNHLVIGYSKRIDQIGWSLIELLITLTIIAILAAVAVPTLYQSIQPTNRMLMQTELLQLAQQLEEGYIRNHVYQMLDVGMYPEQDPQYTVSLTIESNGQHFVLQATPLGRQQEDGLLYLNDTGDKRLYAGSKKSGRYVSW